MRTEHLFHPDTEESQPTGLRGRLIADFANKSVPRIVGRGIDTSTKLVMSDEIGIVGLEGSADSHVQILDGTAELFEGVNISGIWHYSANLIHEFSEEIATRTGGKFGHGTYFGIGALSGETVDALKAGDTLKHNASFQGNIAVVRRENVRATARILRQQQGVPISNIRTTIQNEPLSELFDNFEHTDSAIDAVMVIMDQENTSAELVVLPSSTNHISIAQVT